MILEDVLAQQRQNAFLWVPVLLGTGIGFYYGLRAEPSWAVGAAGLGLCALAAFALWLKDRQVTTAFLLAAGFFLVALGWNVAQWRTHAVAAPVLVKKMDPAMVEGTIVSLDSLDEGRGTRVILRDLVIEDLVPDKTPHVIRLSIRKDEGLRPGQRIRVLAGLNPPSPPVMPGSFDFQRHMYFLRIGGLGFAYKAPEFVAAPERGSHVSEWLESFRQKQANHVRDVVREPEAAIASALLLGERAAISGDVWQDIRSAGLAHVISISGLHIGLIAGGVFLVVRFLMALVPRFALYHPIKKYAAVIALLACTLYAVMVGLSVPTLRSVIMTGLVLVAVMLDRSPFSMRLVALSALLILMTTPEALTGPSFQMSFGAVAALIFFYDETRDLWARFNRNASWWRKPVLYVAGICVTSLVATLATAPFTLYHFQQFPIYSVIGNVLALPVIGFVVMPAAVIAYILMPLGLDAWPLQVMGWGIEIMLDIAGMIAAWPKASLNLPAWTLSTLISFTVAGVGLMLLKGPLRWISMVPLLLGFIFVFTARQPDLLVSGNGKLMMVRLDDRRAYLSNRRSEKFMAENWARAAGLGRAQIESFPKEGAVSAGENSLSCDPYGCRVKLDGRMIALSFDPRTVREDCGQADLLISSKPVKNCDGMPVVDLWDLKDGGTHALWVGPQSIRIKTVEGERGLRPWVPDTGKGFSSGR